MHMPGGKKDEFPVFNIHVAEREQSWLWDQRFRRTCCRSRFAFAAASDATASQSLADSAKHARENLVDVEEREAFQREFIANMMAVKESQLEAWQLLLQVSHVCLAARISCRH